MNVILLLFNSFLENIWMISFTKIGSQYQNQVYLLFSKRVEIITTSVDIQSYNQL